MSTPERVEKDIKHLVSNERLAVLSTNQKNQPYASLVAFAATDDLKTIVFCTPQTTRKFANLNDNPQVALLIENSRNQAADIYSAFAATAIGVAKVLSPGRAKDDLKKLYLQKHPQLADFLRAETTALVEVKIQRYLMVQNFQNVYDYRVDQ